MPIYDFQCTSCGLKDELMRKISEPTTINCPQCSQETFAKMLSAPSFQLSGSGWYASDFKDKKTDKSTTPDKLEIKSSQAETKAPANSAVSACD
jgi:putative FmdB family regulatory protein